MQVFGKGEDHLLCLASERFQAGGFPSNGLDSGGDEIGSVKVTFYLPRGISEPLAYNGGGALKSEALCVVRILL